MVTSFRDALAACGSLSSALRVGLAQEPPWQVVEVVVQDEFTHDVVFARMTADGGGGGGGGAVIVLDCT